MSDEEEPTKRWKIVVLRNGVVDAVTVEANIIKIMDGALVIQDDDEQLVHMFAKGEWKEVVRLSNAS